MLPNAFTSLRTRPRELYARDNAEELKLELQNENRSPINMKLSEDQKRRLLNIAVTLGARETETLTGISEKNIFRWRRSGLVRKKGSGRKVQFSQFEEKLVEYFNSLRAKGMD